MHTVGQTDPFFYYTGRQVRHLRQGHRCQCWGPLPAALRRRPWLDCLKTCIEEYISTRLYKGKRETKKKNHPIICRLVILSRSYLRRYSYFLLCMWCGCSCVFECNTICTLFERILYKVERELLLTFCFAKYTTGSLVGLLQVVSIGIWRRWRMDWLIDWLIVHGINPLELAHRMW